METVKRPRVRPELLVAVAVGLVVLTSVVMLHNAHWVPVLATIGWKMPI